MGPGNVLGADQEVSALLGFCLLPTVGLGLTSGLKLSFLLRVCRTARQGSPGEGAQVLKKSHWAGGWGPPMGTLR